MNEARSTAIQELIAQLDWRINDRATSVPTEPVEFGAIRETPLYRAVQGVQQHYPGGQLPVNPWRAWMDLLRRADDGQGEQDEYERYARCYELAEEIRAWAVEETEKPPVEPPPGYVQLSAVIHQVEGDYSRADRIIKKYGIADWKPSPQSRRRWVNAEQWLNHFRDFQPNDKAIEQFLEGMDSRKESIPKKPHRKPRRLPKR